ncbi:MAG: glycosyltransferase family 2 protein [Candidatus Hodarchaeota archaeon]
MITVIIPCRNEKDFIDLCLDSVVTQDYPKTELEVLVVDGMSEDGTREIVEDYERKYHFVRILDNPKRITPSALNIGVNNAKGEVIVIIGSHSRYEKGYITKCVKYLNEYNVDNIGGVITTFPRNNTLMGKAIANALSSPFGVGDSTFRTGSKEPKWVDTVFGGCYRKEIFEKIGLFNENLQKGQDFEFNNRLRKTGGKILLVPEIESYYYARSTLDKTFYKYYFGEGFWAVYPVRFVGRRFICLWRLVPFIFVLSLIGTGILAIFFTFFWWLFLSIIGLYFLANLCASIKISTKEKDFRYLIDLPIVFASIHISYGIGTAYAILKLLL